jgi:uncharacterized RmlC-like cupin family protein
VIESAMTDAAKWRTGVTVVRAAAQEAARLGTGGTGRATVVDYAGTGGHQTWIGTVTLQPKAKTGMHYHGRHEVTIYVVKGRSEIRWGERLEFAADVGPGDFVYFAPYVPHQELNLDESETVDFVVVRSDNEKIVVALDDKPVERPERMY